jgi:predicted phage terminase large subunit-like protein
MTNDLLKELTIDEIKQGRARHSHLYFMKYVWQRQDPMLVGIHTRGICDAIDRAFKRFREGKSTFLITLCCFRQGKSEITSRYLPPHFLGEFPDKEVVLASHSTGLALKFSRFSRSILRDPKYQELYPEVQLSKEKSGVEEWGIEGTNGKAQYLGIGAGSAGMGGSLVIIDDYFGKREDAESERIRDKVFDSFSDDFFSRRADPCIFMITVTPWHVDDMVGRIKKKMDEDPDYPQFEFLKYPAFSSKYPEGVLFPEMYSHEWYQEQTKVLGKYGTASLMNCDPQIRGGNHIRTDKIKYYDKTPDNLRWYRAWDLASSSKQTQKDDPDFTVGVKMAVKEIRTSIPGVTVKVIIIDDIVRGQWEALARDEIIRSTAIADGPIPIGVEAFGAYKDAYTSLCTILKGIRTVIPIRLSGDKVAKSDSIVPIFEAGNVYMKKAPWNDEVIAVIGSFPAGSHDDDVDAIVCGYSMPENLGGLGPSPI